MISTSAAGSSGSAEAVEDPERLTAGDHDVEAAVFEALEHLRRRGRCSRSIRAPAVVIEQDPDRLAALQRRPDHPLVALLEDVERDALAGEEDERQLEDRQRDGSWRRNEV